MNSVHFAVPAHMQFHLISVAMHPSYLQQRLLGLVHVVAWLQNAKFGILILTQTTSDSMLYVFNHIQSIQYVLMRELNTIFTFGPVLTHHVILLPADIVAAAAAFCIVCVFTII